MARIAIFHPSDPLGHVPSGIDSVIRGILKWAPPDLEYTLFGATADPTARPVGYEAALGDCSARFTPLISVDPTARRRVIPYTLRYMRALRDLVARSGCAEFDVLDFHRVEPLWLFRRLDRPKNVFLHQDMSVLRDKDCDILWRHAPWLYERMERRLFADANHIFTVRQTAVERYRKIYPEFADRIAFIPTWVDPTVFTALKSQAERSQAREELAARCGLTTASARFLISVGRLDKQKDPLLLLQAFREVSRGRTDLHLAIVGDGALRGVVERTCEALELRGRVHLLGALRPADIARVLRGGELFVLSSAYEGMPIAVLEALASGLPVVSTEVGEVPLVVRHGVNGIICANRTPQGLADAIDQGLRQVDSMAGEPCTTAAAAYRPERVLSLIYERHRAQFGLRRAS